MGNTVLNCRQFYESVKVHDCMKYPFQLSNNSKKIKTKRAKNVSNRKIEIESIKNWRIVSLSSLGTDFKQVNATFVKSFSHTSLVSCTS